MLFVQKLHSLGVPSEVTRVKLAAGRVCCETFRSLLFQVLRNKSMRHGCVDGAERLRSGDKMLRGRELHLLTKSSAALLSHRLSVPAAEMKPTCSQSRARGIEVLGMALKEYNVNRLVREIYATN